MDEHRPAAPYRERRKILREQRLRRAIILKNVYPRASTKHTAQAQLQRDLRSYVETIEQKARRLAEESRGSDRHYLFRIADTARSHVDTADGRLAWVANLESEVNQ